MAVATPAAASAPVVAAADPEFFFVWSNRIASQGGGWTRCQLAIRNLRQRTPEVPLAQEDAPCELQRGRRQRQSHQVVDGGNESLGQVYEPIEVCSTRQAFSRNTIWG